MTAPRHSPDPAAPSQRRRRAGLAMGAGAILLWSSNAALTRQCGSQLGIWPFVAVAATIGSITQFAIFWATTRSCRQCVVMPLRLWAAMVLGPVVNVIVYALALLTSTSAAQLYAVNLINYLWPVLSVLCAILWVPETRPTWRLFAAVALSLSGVLLANAPALSAQTNGAPFAACGAYGFAAAAAVSWAIYSVLLARWRNWASGYATAPLGFLIVAVIAWTLTARTGTWPAVDARSWLGVVLAGIGPYGLAFLLWEQALHRTSAATLGLMAAAAPVLSTLLLSFVAGEWPCASVTAATGMIAASVVLCMRRAPRENAEVPDATMKGVKTCNVTSQS